VFGSGVLKAIGRHSSESHQWFWVAPLIVAHKKSPVWKTYFWVGSDRHKRGRTKPSEFRELVSESIESFTSSYSQRLDIRLICVTGISEDKFPHRSTRYHPDAIEPIRSLHSGQDDDFGHCRLFFPGPFSMLQIERSWLAG
jgi:hypothetical protein